LGPGERLHIPIFHDKLIFQVNDLPHKAWIHDGRMPLQKKGQGHAIHMSDFINSQCPECEQLQTTDAHEIMNLGKNYDGYWTNDQLVKQMKHMIQIFEWMYPNTVAEFIFDQSPAHGAFAKDALHVNGMNI
ncbi:hypothetical protein BJV74DRAFT_708390, partial [Russula compacta]